MGIITVFYEHIMKHYIISIIIALSMVATPVLAAVGLPLSCDDQECCHAMAAHPDMAGMGGEACQCPISPLIPCHIAPDQPSPHLAITVSKDRGKSQDSFSMGAVVHTDATELLPEPVAWDYQGLKLDLHPPSIYLRDCALII